jgi:transmembrane sensor
VRSADNEPAIELISGEAAVTSSRTSRNPLKLLAGDGRITAAQAKFDARCLDNVVSVTCLEGVVNVERAGTTMRLREGQQVSYSSKGISTAMTVDPEQVTAWQSGLLIFRDRPLGSVVDEVNRYRPGKIIIVNFDLRRRLVNGAYQISKLDDFVAQVQQLFGARVTSLPGGILLLI